MKTQVFESLSPISCSSLFQMTANIYKGRDISEIKKNHFLLPDTSFLFREDFLGNAYMGWNEKALMLSFDVNTILQHSFFPQFKKGDCIEVFIDTRDLKTTKTIHRFCHHFVFFPQDIGHSHVKEITRFRSDDYRSFVDISLIDVSIQVKKEGYTLEVLFPKETLIGFEPSSLGFTYIIHRMGKKPKHFAVSSDLFSVELSPHLWASLKLLK